MNTNYEDLNCAELMRRTPIPFDYVNLSDIDIDIYDLIYCMKNKYDFSSSIIADEIVKKLNNSGAFVYENYRGRNRNIKRGWNCKYLTCNYEYNYSDFTKLVDKLIFEVGNLLADLLISNPKRNKIINLYFQNKLSNQEINSIIKNLSENRMLYIKLANTIIDKIDKNNNKFNERIKLIKLKKNEKRFCELSKKIYDREISKYIN